MMASSSNLFSASSAPDSEAHFDHFYTEVKAIEKRDSVLTSDQQIERLMRPGSSYFNLNPFEVLQVDPDLPQDEIKKKYKRLSILVHPDKNQGDSERAQEAFEIVNRSWKILECELTRAKCMEIVEEAKGRTDLSIEEKKKKMKKDGKEYTELSPDEYKRQVYVLTMKLFADMERKRRDLDKRDMEERKRKREQEIEVEEKTKQDKEWQQNFEESRQNRVESWKTFQAGGSKKKKSMEEPKPKKIKLFKPPKHKAETR
jgi:DnaJ homolog subfamily C member 8